MGQRKKKAAKKAAAEGAQHQQLQRGREEYAAALREKHAHQLRQNDECCVCLERAVEVTTNCGHDFCSACINAVVQLDGPCPTCREPVTRIHEKPPAGSHEAATLGSMQAVRALGPDEMKRISECGAQLASDPEALGAMIDKLKANPVLAQLVAQKSGLASGEQLLEKYEQLRDQATNSSDRSHHQKCAEMYKAASDDEIRVMNRGAEESSRCRMSEQSLVSDSPDWWHVGVVCEALNDEGWSLAVVRSISADTAVVRFVAGLEDMEVPTHARNSHVRPIPEEYRIRHVEGAALWGPVRFECGQSVFAKVRSHLQGTWQ